MNYPECLIGYLHGCGYLCRIVIHEDYISSLDGCIRTKGSHGDSYICSRKYRGVIDSISDKCKLLLLSLGCDELLNLIHLVSREKFTSHLIHAKLASDCICNLLRVTCEHDNLLHACCLETTYGLLCIWLYNIRYQDVAGISAIHCHVYLCSN